MGLGSLVQAEAKGQKAIDRARQLVTDDSVAMTPADVARLFQPVLFTTPPEVDRLVNDNDMAYVMGLRGLQQNLEALGRATPAEKAAFIQQAQMALSQARMAHAGLADKFTDVGNEGLSRQFVESTPTADRPGCVGDPGKLVDLRRGRKTTT